MDMGREGSAEMKDAEYGIRKKYESVMYWLKEIVENRRDRTITWTIEKKSAMRFKTEREANDYAARERICGGCPALIGEEDRENE